MIAIAPAIYANIASDAVVHSRAGRINNITPRNTLNFRSQPPTLIEIFITSPHFIVNDIVVTDCDVIQCTGK
jgi:hypothetical protein